jgi:hypothetical protein
LACKVGMTRKNSRRERSGFVPDRSRIARALGALELKGLVGHEGPDGQACLRWILWPLSRPVQSDPPSGGVVRIDNPRAIASDNGGVVNGANPTNLDIQQKTGKEDGTETSPLRALHHNGSIPDPDLRLVRLFSEHIGAAGPLGRRGVIFVQAISEARAAGATDAMIARAILESTATAAPWTAPNAARAEARALVEAFNRQVGLHDRLLTVVGIVDCVVGCRKAYAAAERGHFDGDVGVVAGVVGWARANAEALRRAAVWPQSRQGRLDFRAGGQQVHE